MRILRRKDVEDLFTPDQALEVMGAVFAAHARGEVRLPPRLFVEAERERGSVAFMPALVQPDNALGMKSIALYPENPSRFNLPTILGSLLLLDARNGETLALMDAAPITARRTAAVSALATDFLAREDAATAGFLGSGVQARAHGVALTGVRPLEAIRVYSRTASHAEAFASWASRTLEVDAAAVPSPQEAVTDCDIVTSATPSPSPILHGSWIGNGTHLNVIGSGPAMELDAEAYSRADRIVVDSLEHALGEARDIVAYVEQGLLSEDDIDAELGELVSGRAPGRQGAAEVTLFRAIGLAMEDVSAARAVYDAAVRRQRGVELPFP